MNIAKPVRILSLSNILLREQLREPISLLWTLISPCALFYLITFNNSPNNWGNESYIESTAGFYAYISCSVAFFGVAFYIIGRRESGFIRSFIYTSEAKIIFLASHLLCYLITAITYCITFYIITKPSFGPYNTTELGSTVCKFLTCFIIFCSPALYLANRRLKFQSANTVISILIFTMILLALLTTKTQSKVLDAINSINVFSISKNIMTDSTFPWLTLIISSLALITMFVLTSTNLKVNPVWSRY